MKQKNHQCDICPEKFSTTLSKAVHQKGKHGVDSPKYDKIESRILPSWKDGRK